MKTVWAFIHFIVIFIILFDFVDNKKLQKSFEEIFGDGWHLKGMGEEGEAKLAKTIAQENEEQKRRSSETQSNQHQPLINGEGSTTKTDDQSEENDQQQRKREIIRKFRAIKEKIKQRKGRQSHKEWLKLDGGIAKRLGTNRNKIYKWISELGLRIKKHTYFTDEEKCQIVQQFRALKEEIKRQLQNVKWSREQWTKIEELLAKKLGTNRKYIYKWISEFGMGTKKQLTDEQKRNNVLAFQAIKQAIKQKGSRTKKEWIKIEELLAKKLGTNRDNIYKWSREMGLGIQQMLTNSERMALIKKYWAMKRTVPAMSDKRIAKALKISERSISRWKSQFREMGMEMKRELIAEKEDRKRVIVHGFKAIKAEISQQKWARKWSREQWHKMENLLAKKLGTSRRTIYKWIKKIGWMSTKKGIQKMMIK